ncbi:MAG: CAP domain-containing protein [Cryomorphaceae bacterium]|nr:CAP domain-containing protein [Cryomorphaceae bacterium]
MIYIAFLLSFLTPPDSLLDKKVFEQYMEKTSTIDERDYADLLSVGLFHKINDYRIDNNLHPLQWDNLVYEAAAIHSKAMTNSSFFSHTNTKNKKWKTPKDRLEFVKADFYAWAENIAAFNEARTEQVDSDQIYTWIDQLFNQWKNSMPHKKNMLNETYTHSGISCYFSPAAMRENRVHVNATNVFTAKK